MNKIVLISILVLVTLSAYTLREENDYEYINNERKALFVKKVNQVRADGCFCGRKYYPPTTPVEWNETLYRSALGHAKEMTRYNFFAHYSIHGEDIGERLENYGYDWQVAGENLGEGQRTFDEVMNDWLDSRSHCEMLMNPKVNEMGVAYHGRYWVQHFGLKMPKNAVKKGRKYTH